MIDLLMELSLCVLAWSLATLKFRQVWRNGVWKTDPIALSVWLAMLFFAITMTFLVDDVASTFDTVALNNLSRLIAYSSISITLFFITAASIYTFRNPEGTRLLRLSMSLLVGSLFTLFVLYALYISKIPEWRDHHVPQNLPEALFMATLYFFALSLCLVLVTQNMRYLYREKALLMRIRVMTIILTALTALLYFAVKIILVAGYFWPPLSSDSIVAFSKLLLILSALMFVISFVPNRVYLRLIRPAKNISNWLAIRELDYLLQRLDLLCPPISLVESKPSLRNFLPNSDYYLYRATIRILDSKTMLADYIKMVENQERPDWWDDALLQEARHINRILRSIHTSGDFTEIVRSFRIASRQLLRHRQYQPVEAML